MIKKDDPELYLISQKTQDLILGKLDTCIVAAKKIMDEAGVLFPFALTFSPSTDINNDDLTFVGDFGKKESRWDEDTVWKLQKELHMMRNGLTAGAVIYSTKIGKFDAFSISIEHRYADEAVELIIPYIIQKKTRQVKLRWRASKKIQIKKFIWKEEL